MCRAVVICVALCGGCGDPEVEQLRHVKDTVCACKTASCAEDALGHVPQREIKAGHKAQRIARDMLDCLAKLYAAERPDTDEATSPETSDHASARTP